MKTIIKNYLSDIIPEFLIVLLNLILLKLFYSNLGTEIYALNQLFSQFFAYLLLAEAGFASASLVSLYKPISDGNIDEINRKLSGIRYIFRIIGIIMIVLGVIFSFFIPSFIKDNSINNTYIQITFILYLISNSLNYFYYTYRVLYDAKQKKYISNLIYQIGSIVKYIVEIIVLLLGFKFEILLISCILCNLLTNIFMKRYALEKNKELKFTKNKDISMLKNTKDLIVHKISGIISNNIDIVLISKFLGLSSVAIYSAYNYILNELTKLTSKIGISLYSIIGIKHFGTAKKEEEKENFIVFNSFIYYIASVICATLVFSYTNFIRIFYGNELTASCYLTYIFIFLIFFQIIRTPLNSYINGCGLFKETKICTIVEGIINLILSLITIKKFGMGGIIISTIISYIVADFILKPIIIKKHLELYSLKSFYWEMLKNIMCIIILIIINYNFMNIEVNSLINWFLISAGLFIGNIVLGLAYFKMIKRAKWFSKIFDCFRRRKNEI